MLPSTREAQHSARTHSPRPPTYNSPTYDYDTWEPPKITHFPRSSTDDSEKWGSPLNIHPSSWGLVRATNHCANTTHLSTRRRGFLSNSDSPPVCISTPAAGAASGGGAKTDEYRRGQDSDPTVVSKISRAGLSLVGQFHAETTERSPVTQLAPQNFPRAVITVRTHT